jgi:hypothetical protein
VRIVNRGSIIDDFVIPFDFRTAGRLRKPPNWLHDGSAISLPRRQVGMRRYSFAAGKYWHDS